ncbi:MAG: gephyrin-like molybdotransferase Glp, partial [Candidatus Eremiobacterota bacterium]
LLAEIPAGSVPPFRVGPGQAAPIMTGAMLPEGADACVMVEDSRLDEGRVHLERAVSVGENVRRRGEHLQTGEVVVRAGRPVRPADVAMAASLGYPALSCIPRPRVAILSTGSELVEPGLPLAPGKIRDSNSYALEALVLSAGAQPLRLGVVPDRPATLEEAVRRAVSSADVLITSAGVSVGEHDYVRAALEKMGGQLALWRIRMRPGKPLAFGCAGLVPMFGLPGNPVSTMVGFEIFVRPALARMLGRAWQPRRLEARLGEPLRKKAGFRMFLRCRLSRNGEGWTAATTGSQGSHILRSMVEADGLMDLSEDVESLAAGDRVTVLALDYSA